MTDSNTITNTYTNNYLKDVLLLYKYLYLMIWSYLDSINIIITIITRWWHISGSCNQLNIIYQKKLHLH